MNKREKLYELFDQKATELALPMLRSRLPLSRGAYKDQLLEVMEWAIGVYELCKLDHENRKTDPDLTNGKE